MFWPMTISLPLTPGSAAARVARPQAASTIIERRVQRAQGNLRFMQVLSRCAAGARALRCCTRMVYRRAPRPHPPACGKAMKEYAGWRENSSATQVVVLPPCLVDDHRDRVAQVEAALA